MWPRNVRVVRDPLSFQAIDCYEGFFYRANNSGAANYVLNLVRFGYYRFFVYFHTTDISYLLAALQSSIDITTTQWSLDFCCARVGYHWCTDTISLLFNRHSSTRGQMGDFIDNQWRIDKVLLLFNRYSSSRCILGDPIYHQRRTDDVLLWLNR